MKNFFLFFAAWAIFTAFPAYAENDLALCRLRSAQYHAAADVAYKPGVDVHGNPVVPADLNAAPPLVQDVIRIPLNVDLAQRLGVLPSSAEMKADMGMVEIRKDGKVTYNGEDLTPQIAVLCEDQIPASAPVQATAQPTKVVVPQGAPPIPVTTTTVPVTAVPPPQVQSRTVIPPNAVASKPLPPHTLGQFTIPAPSQAPRGENESPAQDKEIIWGEGH